MKSKFIRNTIILSILSIIVVFVPTFLIKFDLIDAYTAQIITLAGINAIMALSVNIICGITGQLSLGQAGFMVLGCYATIIFTQILHIPVIISVVFAGLTTAFFGFLIGFPTLKLTGDYLAIVTLAFGEIIRVVLVNLSSISVDLKNKISDGVFTPDQIPGKEKLVKFFSLFGPNGCKFSTKMVLDPALAFFVVTGVLVILIILIQNFIRSTYGRAILAVREDEIAARSSGIPVFRYKMIGFVIASFVAGIGGALYVCLIGFVKPDQGSFNNSINYLIFVVFGGMGSTTGSILASYVLTYLQEFLRFMKDYRMLLYPVVLIIVMIFRPQGLLGYKEVSFIKFFGWAKKGENWKKLFTPKKKAKAAEASTEGGK